MVARRLTYGSPRHPGLMLLWLLVACSGDRGTEPSQTGDPQIRADFYDDSYPAPRPGSGDVAFIRRSYPFRGIENLPEPGLYLYEDATGDCRLLLPLPVQRSVWLDSDRIVVPRGSYGQGPLYILQVETGDLTLLQPVPLGGLAVSPQGDRIAFEVAGKLGILDLGTGEIQQFWGGGFRTPTWHPSGETLTAPRRALQGHAFNLVEVSLTWYVLSEYTKPVRHHVDEWPSYNSDGTLLTFERMSPSKSRGTRQEVMVLPTTGSKALIVAEGRFPAFSTIEPAKLYYSLTPPRQEYGRRIIVLDLDTAKKRQLTW